MERIVIINEIIECFNNIGIMVDNDDLSDFDMQNFIEDSIMFITFIIELETKFEIEVPDEYFMPDKINSFDDIVDLIYLLKTNTH